MERKLTMLEAAGALDDLRVPPGNRLEALVGDRAGQHSIRVNDQFASVSAGPRRAQQSYELRVAEQDKETTTALKAIRRLVA